MNAQERKAHWENIYTTKPITNVSWYQPTPQTSLDFIAKCNINKDAAIIDIGGGDSFLVDHLLELGYTNITVLDISATAIERAKERLGSKAELVKWIVSDVVDFIPTEKYAVWHDRAAFHFLNSEDQIKSYTSICNNSITENGNLIISTFSNNGPLKCSAIEITQYTEDKLKSNFNELKFQDSLRVNHPTPFDTEQEFVFCWFKK